MTGKIEAALLNKITESGLGMFYQGELMTLRPDFTLLYPSRSS